MPWLQDCPKHKPGQECKYREAGYFECGGKPCKYEVGCISAARVTDNGICYLETEEDILADGGA